MKIAFLVVGLVVSGFVLSAIVSSVALDGWDLVNQFGWEGLLIQFSVVIGALLVWAGGYAVAFTREALTYLRRAPSGPS